MEHDDTTIGADSGPYNSKRALAELQRHEPDFALDQLKRTAEAVLAAGPGVGRSRRYNTADLELILVAHRLRVATDLRYGNLTLLVRDAQDEGRDPTKWFRTLLEREQPGQAPESSTAVLEQALAELRRHQPDFTMDQLHRAAEALLLTPSPDGARTRPFSAPDLELILVAHRLRIETGMRYGNLTLLVRDAQDEGRDPTKWFRTLLERERSRRPRTAFDSLPELLTA